VGAVVVVVAAAGEAATYAVGRLPGAGGALGGDGGDGGGSRIVQSVLDLGTAAESMEGVQEGEGAASVADHAMEEQEEQEEEDVRILASPLVLCFRPHQTWGTSQHVNTDEHVNKRAVESSRVRGVESPLFPGRFFARARALKTRHVGSWFVTRSVISTMPSA